MEYNTLRPQLKITDYGRHIVKLIEQAKALPTREQRNKAANIIVRTMGAVNPKVRLTDNYKRELWEHLMILANWELDCSCPYKLTPQERVAFQPRRILRQRTRIEYPHYGRCLQEMINKVAAMPDSREKDLQTAMIIAQMKKSYIVWNHTVHDNMRIDDYSDVVLKQLDHLSGGRLREGSIRLDINPASLRTINTHIQKKKKKKK